MVHALESASELTKRGGVLIIVHDTPISPSIELHQGADQSIAGWLYDMERFPLIREADRAVDQLIEFGHVALTSNRVFPYQTRIDSYEGFREWLDKQWETSYLPTHIEQRIEGRFLAGGTGTRVFINQQARIWSLKIF